MNLESDKRLNIQLRLDFSSAPTGEARQALREALRQVRSNKGSAGIDRMTVDQLGDYLKQHWPVIREQLLNGTYEPKPVRRVEIPKPDGGGVRKLGIPTVLDRFIQQAVMQGSAEAMEPDILPIQLRVPTASVGASSRGPSAAVHCARLRMGDRSRFGKIFRSSQS